MKIMYVCQLTIMENIPDDKVDCVYKVDELNDNLKSLIMETLENGSVSIENPIVRTIK